MRWRSSTLFSPRNGTIESSVGTRALGLSREWLGHPRPLERMAGAPSPSRENGWGALALSREWLGHPRPLEKMSTRECQQGENADRGNPNTRRAPVLGAPLAGEGGSAVGWLPPFSTPPPHTHPHPACVSTWPTSYLAGHRLYRRARRRVRQQGNYFTQGRTVCLRLGADWTSTKLPVQTNNEGSSCNKAKDSPVPGRESRGRPPRSVRTTQKAFT
jgi:hypothetical protein